VKIRTQILTIISLITIATSLIFSVVTYTTQRDALLSGIDDKLFAAAHFTRGILPPD